MMLSTNSVHIIFMFGLVCVQGGSIDFSDCGSDYEILEVNIEGCEVIPCHLQIGVYYDISLRLTPKFPSNSLTQEAYVTVYDSVDIKIHVLPENPCISLPCPVKNNETTKFEGKLYVGYNLVPEKGMLWWKMQRDTGSLAICMKTTVLIESKRSQSNFLMPK